MFSLKSTFDSENNSRKIDFTLLLLEWIMELRISEVISRIKWSDTVRQWIAKFIIEEAYVWNEYGF